MERQYPSSQNGGGFFTRQLASSPVVKWLLIINIAVFFIDIALISMKSYGVYSIQKGLLEFQIWRLISFQFFHSNQSLFHLFFNMYGLFMFGPIVENKLRSRPFLIFYLICGIAGALLYTLLSLLPGILPRFVGDQLLGASAGIFGILIGVAMIAPQGTIRLLFPPIPMTMKTFALAICGIEVFLLLINASNAGGSAGHLGGAFMGFLFFRLSFLRNWLQRLNQSPIYPSRAAKKKRVYEKKLKPRTKIQLSRNEDIDEILDKINEHGLHSLSEEERKILHEESKR